MDGHQREVLRVDGVGKHLGKLVLRNRTAALRG